MNYFEMAYTALGGLGFFFLGIRYLSDSLQTLAGNFIQKLINAVTTNRIIAVGVGVAITTIIQSSSITTVMVVGMVNAGLMNLMQAIGVILGANIGTTITGWILVFKVGKYGLLFLGLGIFPMLFSKKNRFSASGKLLVSLGLIFFGLELMSGAFKPLRTDPGFVSYLHYFQADSFLSVLGCVVIGCLLTFVIQSSSAMLAITIALAATGTITFQTSAALVLGENIGTTITALLASIGTNKTAKQAAISHAIFNVIGVSIIVCIFPYYVRFIELIVSHPADFTTANGEKPYITEHIAMAHTMFNVTAVLLMLPFIQYLASFVQKIVPSDQTKKLFKLTYHSGAGIHSAEFALGIAYVELRKMYEQILETLKHAKDFLLTTDKNERALSEVIRLEEMADELQEEIITFACGISEGNLSIAQSEKAYCVIRIADEMESISDCARTLCNQRLRLINSSIYFEDSLKIPLETFCQSVFENLKSSYQTISEIVDGKTPPQKIRQLLSETRKISKEADSIVDNQLSLTANANIKPILYLTFSDMVLVLKELNGHLQNIIEVLISRANIDKA